MDGPRPPSGPTRGVTRNSYEGHARCGEQREEIRDVRAHNEPVAGGGRERDNPPVRVWG